MSPLFFILDPFNKRMYEITQAKETLRALYEALSDQFKEQNLYEIKVLKNVLLLKFQGSWELEVDRSTSARFFSKKKAAELAKVPLKKVTSIGAGTNYINLDRKSNRLESHLDLTGSRLAQDSLMSQELRQSVLESVGLLSL